MHISNRIASIEKDKIDNQKELVSQQLQLAMKNAKRQIEIQANALQISKEQLRLSEKVSEQTQVQFKESRCSFEVHWIDDAKIEEVE